MDFSFSEEQEMLRASARELVNDRYRPERVALGGQPGGLREWSIERDREGVDWRSLPTVDSTGRVVEVGFDRAPAGWLGVGVPAALAPVRDRTLAALAAEAVGVGQAALD